MLILSRRIDESLKIGDDVTVTVLGVRGGQVRLGIQAPRSVPVDRKEVRDQKKCRCDFDPTHGGSAPCPVHDGQEQI
jgi:carbon storage regulator